MPFTNYAELQSEVATWMARASMSGRAADFITLAEAHLNREIPAVEVDATLTGVLDNRRIDIAAQSMERAIALFLVDPSSGDELELTQKTDGTFPYLASSSRPSLWAIDGTNIDFDCPLDQAYSFRFRFRQKFSLSDSATTNWLLTNHPDVYLAAVLMWGGVFTRNSPFASTFSAILERVLPSIKSSIAQSKRAVATVDPALASIGRRAFYDGSF
ncbi:hypothetical protein CO731_04862 [Aminobacter sp. MSH1]|uniref:phage adaptor protein n=1 Tax=Aminobacter sp. MSH1 TaxID=374606 RepID=UPI000D374D8D|nr:hypothetical protein [Aminobacter sp. MSH1]AWC25367.1 hypothetical protein CO731_04862 [Aminobacter sp. MSH1]